MQIEKQFFTMRFMRCIDTSGKPAPQLGSTRSKRHLIAAFKRQHFASLGGRCNFVAQLFKHAANFFHLRRVALSHLATPQINAVFQSDSHVCPLNSGIGEQRHLVTTRTEHRPVIVAAE